MATDSHLYRVRSKLLIETFSLLDKTYELKRALISFITSYLGASVVKLSGGAITLQAALS